MPLRIFHFNRFPFNHTFTTGFKILLTLKFIIMKKVIIILFVCLAGLQLHAQNKQEKITGLISIIHSEQITNKMFDNMLHMMMQQSEKSLTKEQQGELSSFIVLELKNMIKKAVYEYYPKIYDKYFTEDDIKELIKFYKSAAGQKYLTVAPDIQNDLMQNYMKTDFLEFQKKVEQKKKEIKEGK